jgi:predicted RNase H-like nuclease (RuvC/YqgF family)|tara:strand:+ start:717 stop:917 length:201 start_codon:yes stop_codon:yes gene_type:complete
MTTFDRELYMSNSELKSFASINILYKNINVLKKQVEEQEQIIKQLRKEISKLKQVAANNRWVELDA